MLIEWEDTFPYSGEISVVGSSGEGAVGYKEDEVERIYKLAEENELLVVPLVQTFGHLEVTSFFFFLFFFLSARLREY